MAETISQVCILLLGLLAIFLVVKKNKWGFVCGLLTQPFWFATAYQHEQWGIFVLNIGCFFLWSYGVWIWFVVVQKNVEKKKRVLGGQHVDHNLLIENMKDSKPFSMTLDGSFSAPDLAELFFAFGAVYEAVGGQELHFHFSKVHILVKPHDHPEW